MILLSPFVHRDINASLGRAWDRVYVPQLVFIFTKVVRKASSNDTSHSVWSSFPSACRGCFLILPAPDGKRREIVTKTKYQSNGVDLGVLAPPSEQCALRQVSYLLWTPVFSSGTRLEALQGHFQKLQDAKM